jgi:hypothetical protein
MRGSWYCSLRELRVGVVLAGVHQQDGVEVEGLPGTRHAGGVRHEAAVHLT